MARHPIFALAAVSLALGLAACGSSSHSSTSGSTSTPSSGGASTSSGGASTSSSGGASASAPSAVADSADPSGSLSFTSTSLKAKAGTVTIDFTNKSPVGHNLTIANSSGKVLGATPTFSGSSKTISVKLTPGTYTFYCSVPGHRQAGMQGTLTVS